MCEDLRLIQTVADDPKPAQPNQPLDMRKLLAVARRSSRKRPPGGLDLRKLIEVAKAEPTRDQGCGTQLRDRGRTNYQPATTIPVAAAAMTTAIQLVRAKAAKIATGLVKKQTGRARDAAIRRLRQVMLAVALGAWTDKCIVDSGASYTYVTRDTPLANVRPGAGHVTVATGKRERISEVGDLGALKNARRVLSFTRTLVSVRDLVDQFHKVIFDGDGVLVESVDGRTRTRIGVPTSNRLYSFDGEALTRHAAAVQVR